MIPAKVASEQYDPKTVLNYSLLIKFGHQNKQQENWKLTLSSSLQLSEVRTYTRKTKKCNAIEFPGLFLQLVFARCLFTPVSICLRSRGMNTLHAEWEWVSVFPTPGFATRRENSTYPNRLRSGGASTKVMNQRFFCKPWRLTMIMADMVEV